MDIQGYTKLVKAGEFCNRMFSVNFFFYPKHFPVFPKPSYCSFFCVKRKGC